MSECEFGNSRFKLHCGILLTCLFEFFMSPAYFHSDIFDRFTVVKSFYDSIKEVNDVAGQHELLAEQFQSSIVKV